MKVSVLTQDHKDTIIGACDSCSKILSDRAFLVEFENEMRGYWLLCTQCTNLVIIAGDG